MQKKAKNGNSIVKVLRKGDDWEIIKKKHFLSFLVAFSPTFTFIFSHQKNVNLCEKRKKNTEISLCDNRVRRVDIFAIVQKKKRKWHLSQLVFYLGFNIKFLLVSVFCLTFVVVFQSNHHVVVRLMMKYFSQTQLNCRFRFFTVVVVGRG